MNTAWSVLGALVLLVATTAVGDLCSDEIRTRLERLPHTLLRLNARLQPAELREDLLDEWQAELDFILRDTGGLPLTRLWRGSRYAASLLRAAPWLARDLTWATAGRVAAGTTGAAISAVGFGIEGSAIGLTWPGSAFFFLIAIFMIRIGRTSSRPKAATRP